MVGETEDGDVAHSDLSSNETNHQEDQSHGRQRDCDARCHAWQLILDIIAISTIMRSLCPCNR